MTVVKCRECEAVGTRNPSMTNDFKCHHCGGLLIPITQEEYDEHVRAGSVTGA